jgi:hypothetical protein
MRKSIVPGALAAVALAALALPAGAVELAAIERKLAKEPTYAGKPAYCLLALGADAKTRVWVVRDGDVVYVDKNGNGDLTEPGEKFTATPDVDDGEDMKVAITQFDLGDLPPIGGKTPYTSLVLHRNVVESKGLEGAKHVTDVAQVVVRLHDKHSQSAAPTFAAKAADAPVAHLDGPLEIRVAPHPKGEPVCLAKDADEHEFTVQIGTLGVGEGSWAPLGYEQVPEDVHPVVEIAFPAAKQDAPAIVVKFTLDSRC